jgi:hypothetical protein
MYVPKTHVGRLDGEIAKHQNGMRVFLGYSPPWHMEA